MSTRVINTIYLVLLLLLIVDFSPTRIFAANWEKYQGNPIFDIGASGINWDTAHVLSPNLIKDGGIYKMLYAGHGGSGWKIGYASSPDGISNWTRTPLPIIQEGSNDGWEKEVNDPAVIATQSGSFQMWFTSTNTDHWISGLDRFRTRYALSNDGSSWTKSNNWLMTGTLGTWDSGGTARGRSIVYKDGMYHMWYGATNENDLGSNPYWRIGYATSLNGQVWHKENDGNPVVSPTEPWELNNTSNPTVIYYNGYFHMWYGAGVGDNPTQIVYAYSSNGISWTKPVELNPAVVTTPGTFDQNYLSTSTVIKESNNLKMWYSGFDGAHWRVGYATASADILPVLPTLTPTLTPSPTLTPTPTPTPTPSATNKIVFIPGFGSTGTFRQLRSCQPSSGNETWELNPLGADAYRGLLRSLQNAGYTVLPFYNDWRKTPYQLAPLVSTLINNSIGPNEKVNFLGHSFGGLVGRAYVEQTQDGSHIDSMLTVGTPHAGLVGAYLAWEGGEAPSWITRDLRIRFGLEMITHYCPLVHRTNTIGAIHQYAPSLQRLLPTFDYLRKPFTFTVKPVTSMFWQNEWLPNTLFSAPWYGIRFGTLAGTGNQTLRELIVSNPSRLDNLRGLWKDGKPIERRFSEHGDDTVLLTSAQVAGADNLPVLPLSHGGLVSTDKGIKAILNYFGAAPQTVAFNALTATEENSAVILMSDTASFDIENEGSTKTSDTDGMIAIINPKTSTRRVNIRPKTDSSQFTVLQLTKDGRALWKEYYFRGRNTNQKRSFRFDENNPIEDPLKQN